MVRECRNEVEKATHEEDHAEEQPCRSKDCEEKQPSYPTQRTVGSAYRGRWRIVVILTRHVRVQRPGSLIESFTNEKMEI